MKTVLLFLIVFPGVLLDNKLIFNSIPCISATAQRLLAGIYDIIDPADRQFLHDLVKEAVQCQLEEEKKKQQQQLQSSLQYQVLNLGQQLQQQQQQRPQLCPPCQPEQSNVCDSSWMGKLFEGLSLSWNVITTLLSSFLGQRTWAYRRQLLAAQPANPAIVVNGPPDADGVDEES